MSQNQGSSNNEVLQHSSGIRNQPGGSIQGGTGPYQRTPANYAGGAGPNANNTITLHAQNGQTKQTTTDNNGAISDADRQWLADNGGAMPISQIPPEDKALVGTGTGAAAQMGGDASEVGTKPLDNRPPGSYNPNTGSVGGQGGNQGNQGGNQGSNQGGKQGNQGGNQGNQGGNQGSNQGRNQGSNQGGKQGNQGGNQGNQGGNQGNQGGNQGSNQGGNQGSNQGGKQGNQGGNQGNQGGNADEEVLQHSSGIRNQPGGSIQGGTGPYQRTPANYAGGAGPNANNTITLHAQNGQTKQTTTDNNGAISDADRQWLADNGGAMPISQIPPEDKALVGTGTGAAAQMGGDASEIGTKPLDNRPPGSYNPNTGSVSGQ